MFASPYWQPPYWQGGYWRADTAPRRVAIRQEEERIEETKAQIRVLELKLEDLQYVSGVYDDVRRVEEQIGKVEGLLARWERMKRQRDDEDALIVLGIQVERPLGEDEFIVLIA